MSFRKKKLQEKLNSDLNDAILRWQLLLDVLKKNTGGCILDFLALL